MKCIINRYLITKVLGENMIYLWLITYDDCTEIRELFSFANIYPWELQYGMTTRKGKELLITNYKI